MIYERPSLEQLRYINLGLKMEAMESAAVLVVDEVIISGDIYTIVCDKWIFRKGTDYEIFINKNGEEIYREVFNDHEEAVETITETINKIYERAN